MKSIKMFLGLQKEDIKRKLWLVLLSWYILGMFCFLFATKTVIPAGEVRSLYVGPGNTSFFAAMVIFGIVMGITGFSYLNSDEKADLFFSLPFSRQQLYLAGVLNDLLLFLVPVLICKLLFFRISLSMGYSRYEDSAAAVWIGIMVLILGFLFLQNLSMLAHFLTRNIGYTLGLLLLFLLGPDLGLHLAEKMMGIFIPSFYRSETLELLKDYVSPFSLLKNAAGIESYVDGGQWILGEHFSYICVLAVLVLLLSCINCVVFTRRPVETKRGVFTFSFVEWFVRYGCVILAVLWLADALQIFAFGGVSKGLALGGVIFGIPIVHVLINVVVSFDVRKFISGKWHLLGEYICAAVLLGIFFLAGKAGGNIPEKKDLDSMAVVLTAIDSGDRCDTALSQMYLTGDELSAAYEWVAKNCIKQQDVNETEGENYEVLVNYRFKKGKEMYCRYYVPWYALDGFGDVFGGEEFKEGMFSCLTGDSLKYYEIQWSNGVETYQLDLNEEERERLWEAYTGDFAALTFSDMRQQVPIGCFTLCSTKNQGDSTGYIYPGFTQTQKLLGEYGLDGEKTIKDYRITKILADKYLETEGLLYHVRSLEWEKEITGEEYVYELAGDLHYEGFCVDTLLNQKNPYLEFTVYYRDSQGKTVNSIKCRAQAAPGENEVLKELMKGNGSF